MSPIKVLIHILTIAVNCIIQKHKIMKKVLIFSNLLISFIGCKQPEQVVQPVTVNPVTVPIIEKKNINIIWAKSFGGDHEDYPSKMIYTKSGNIVIAGFASSASGSGNKEADNKNECWIIQVDKDGKKVFDKSYDFRSDIGFNRFEKKVGIITTKDDGFIIASNDIYSVLLIKIDGKGNKIWSFETDYLGDGFDIGLTDIIENNNGEILLLGTTSNAYYQSVRDVLICLNSSGQRLWNKSYYGKNRLQSKAIFQQPNGDFIIISENKNWIKEDNGLELSGDPKEFWVYKIDSKGKVIFTKNVLSGTKDFELNIVNSSIDKQGNIISIINFVNRLDTPLNYTILCKVNSDGELINQKRLDKKGVNYKNSITLTNKDILLYGSINDPTNFWLRNLSENYLTNWEKEIGGIEEDTMMDLMEIDGYIYMLGRSNSYPITGNSKKGSFTNYDYRLIKAKII